MIAFFSVVLVVAAGCYAGVVSHLAWGLRRVIARAPTARAPEKRRRAGPLPFVSVVIAARNEAGAIGTCLRSVLANDYPPERFEIIVVDDFSEDATAEHVRRLQDEHVPGAHVPGAHVPAGDEAATDAPSGDVPALRLLQMQHVAERSAGHKQAALDYGLRRASGALVLTTDADCTVRPGWMRAMVGCFDEGTAFVAGPVRFRPGGRLFTRMQALEFLGLVAFGGGGIGVGRPSICNSANVAYRRAVREHVLREDAPAVRTAPAADELMLQHVAYETDWRARFCAAPEAVVTTDPAPTLRAFLAQRVRWASMGTRYPRASLVAGAVGLYAFYVLLAAGLAGLLLVPALWPAVLAALALKLSAQRALLKPACRQFGQPQLLRYLLPTQLLQIPYYLYVGLAGAVGPVEWKGRRVG